jgi:SHS2 domain-containing protein
MTTNVIEEIEHTADWAIRVRGRDLRELFINAARGMFGLMADLETVKPSVEQRVRLEEFDTETLLVSWLSELLWFNEESDVVFVRFEIDLLAPTRLEAKAWGGPGSMQEKHIKAVTFHDLKIIETNTGYEVALVFDV